MVAIEDLRKQREHIVQQRDNALAVYNQSVGALMLLDHIISQIEQPQKDALSLDELASALGADSAELVEAPKKDGP